MIHNPKVQNSYKAFSPYDLVQVKDRCNNCEKVNTVKTTITIDRKRGVICRDCFILYKK